ncbi:MAG TPA: hypothetical protein PKA12_02345 [Saprospiraceae bacterium]|nr:hypothetical protein [Saprospiraceae bacterium]
MHDDCSFTFQTFRNNIPKVIEQCKLLVNYTLEECYDANNVAKRIVITKMTWNWSTGCDSIRRSWSDLYVQGFYSELNIQMNSFYNSLSIGLENYEAPNFEGFSCPDSGDPCLAEQSVFEFYVSDGFKRCAYFDERESLYNIIEVKCGDACCRRITKFCYDNGVILRCLSRLVSNYGAYICSEKVPDGLCNRTLFGESLNPCEKVN